VYWDTVEFATFRFSGRRGVREGVGEEWGRVEAEWGRIGGEWR